MFDEKEYNRRYREVNKEKIRAQRKRKYEEIKNNPDYKNKKHEWNVVNKDRISAYNKSYRLNNYDRLKKYDREYEKNKKRNNDKHRILCVLRTRLWGAVKKCDGVKKPTIELLGCEVDYFIKYMESLFTAGMTWDNYGKYGWHIDHIIPCASFDLTNPDQQKACFHYTNLQPLWEFDNLSKSDKIQVITSEGVFLV